MRDATLYSLYAFTQILFQSTRPMRDATVTYLIYLFNLFEFQSTRPMRDATFPRCHTAYDLMISIHASHAGRDGYVEIPDDVVKISIHASHAGRDAHDRISEEYLAIFQSTRPMRDATITRHR